MTLRKINSYWLAYKYHKGTRRSKQKDRKKLGADDDSWELCSVQWVCAPLWWMSWSVEREEWEVGKTACTAGVISSRFGRKWQRFITRLNKCIIERVISSAGAVGCTPNPGETQTKMYFSWELHRCWSWLTCVNTSQDDRFLHVSDKRVL